MCGGIGSGKSWAGSYDVIKRGKPGRLYMVVAPTHGMLSDSTMRSFLTVAQQLEVYNPRKVKMSAPCSMTLRTGAEVLFRSGDDPDHLYGPNLSGIWLDEASLMPKEVFTVGIGRLREGGEQGWLGCTFTPKGKQHWTYETFASGKPNTAAFFCKTSDNPFLPPDFCANVASQYTTRMQLQELEGQFIDIEGGMFQRAWFPIVEASPKEGRRVRYWDQAGTAGAGAYTVGLLMLAALDAKYYVEDVVRGQWSAAKRDAMMLQTARADKQRYGRVDIWCEQEPGSGGLESAQAKIKLLAGFNVHTERATGDKATRAEPFAAQAEGGNVRLVRGPWNAAYVDEMAVAPEGPYKDQMDGSSGAFNKLAGKKQFWMRLAGVGGGVNPDKYEKEIQKLIDSGCKRLPNGQGIVRPDGVIQVIDLRPDAAGWHSFRKRFG